MLMTRSQLENTAACGWWKQGGGDIRWGDQNLREAILHVTRPVFVVQSENGIGVGREGTLVWEATPRPGEPLYPLKAYVPPLHPEQLGSAQFKQRHRLRYAYLVGAMANGITSVDMVSSAGRAGMLGFFGAAGLGLDEVDEAIAGIKQNLNGSPFGFNLIHSPNDPELEKALVQLYIERGINLVSASAYLDLTLPLVYYRVKGIHQHPDGRVICPNRIIAKVSRVEVARKFLAPAPEKILYALLQAGMIDQTQAALARKVPMADDLTAEADSGGHTDNRPAISLLPTMLALRDEIATSQGYAQAPCVGLGGGIATPHSTAAAFAMGAAYVLAGSVHQGCVEAGTSETVRQMLAEAQQADVIMAPSADMFEMGVKVQVLKRGTMFPLRAARLYDLYGTYDRYEDIPARQRQLLERDVFRCPFETQWQKTKHFFAHRDPQQIVRAEQDPKHKMALVFRSYLGKSSLWAKTGNPSRRIDYQIWCGPTMGAFNQWVRGSFLDRLENRQTVTVAMNLLLGAAVLARLNTLGSQGLDLPPGWNRFVPMKMAEIHRTLNI